MDTTIKRPSNGAPTSGLTVTSGRRGLAVANEWEHSRAMNANGVTTSGPAGAMVCQPVTDMFGSAVFNDAVMRARLPKNVYRALRRTIEQGAELERHVADVVANAMKDWAIEQGATHYCHWFQPMTGITAEKHDSFISPTADGRTMMEFSGKELIQGEPDASSFPSGGLRATFEARGYTAWDCTSPVFIKRDGTNTSLFIPSAFCSYTGETLDKKTPLLRSMDALNRQAMRVLKALGNASATRVTATLGSEQEYFLVDRRFVERRMDLTITGRSLIGAAPPKGQEMEDHYFGRIHERVASFMAEVNSELWKLGVSAKTQHNEVAPAQYEIAPVFATVNVGTDHNQITMETLQKVALRHGFVCLLHEKPFAGVNGSGKHNNWSMVTDDGVNLLDPGTTPHENLVFLTFLFSIIRAVDKYATLLRASVATSGNDHRLGANEAPPAIVSIFLGEQLTAIYEQIAAGGVTSSGNRIELKLGASTLPPLPKDTTDRNRTSPFAFTGNKFEFRMVGSSQSVAGPNFVLNTIVADTLREVADAVESAKDVPAALQKLLQGYAKEHMKVIFNGDNYCQEWTDEAARRGLPNLRNTVDALNVLTDPEITAVFERQAVLSEHELHARYEILLEVYAKQINVEAQVMLHMARRQILPAATEYCGRVAQTVAALKAAGVEPDGTLGTLKELTDLSHQLKAAIGDLENACRVAAGQDGAPAIAAAYRDRVVPTMGELRGVSDRLEMMVDAELWPLPTYSEMLFLR